MSTNGIRPISAAQEPIDHLVGQVTEAADAFQNSHNEADRLAALQAAQRLVTVFQKPQDAVYNLAYSVCCPCMSQELARSTDPTSPPT